MIMDNKTQNTNITIAFSIFTSPLAIGRAFLPHECDLSQYLSNHLKYIQQMK